MNPLINSLLRISTTIILAFATNIVGKIYYEKKINILLSRTLLFFLLFLAIDYIDSIFVSIVFYYLGTYILYYTFYESKVKNTFYVANNVLFVFIPYLFVAYTDYVLTNTLSLIVFKSSLLLVYYIFLLVLIKQIIHSINKILNKHKKKTEIIKFGIERTFWIILFFHLLSYNSTIDSSLIRAGIIVMICTDIFMLLKRARFIKLLTINLKFLERNSLINEIYLTDYRKIVHERNNQLLIIKTQINDKITTDYIDRLVKNASNSHKKMFLDLNYICLPVAKNLIVYKIEEMIKENINLSVYVSPEISYAQKNLLEVEDRDDLYCIIGILIDNAKEAAIKSIERFVSIEIYRSDSVVKFVVANTFAGEVELDKITNMGYSTKGKNRGLGLNIVADIVKNNKIYDNHVYLSDNYFVNTLEIDVSKKNKNV